MHGSPKPTANASLTIGCLLALVTAAALAPAAQATPPPTPVDASSLEAGDVVAEGVPTPVGCRFDEPTRVRIQPAELGSPGGAHMDLETMPDCRMVVQSVGPTPPAYALLAATGGGHSRSDDPNSTSSDDGGGAGLMASSKKVVTEVIHYGDGGKDDELTMKDQWIDFSWDGSEAWINDHAGSCWWVSGWVNDACVLDEVISPADPVSRASHGDFHYEDVLLDGYYHTLEAYTYGYADGDYWCDYVWDGDIVNGVYMNCYLD